MSGDWLAALAACRGAREAAVLVTVAAVEGSAPREAGAKMLVTAARQAGTIGGGTLEFETVQRARRLLRDGARSPVLETLPLGPALGQCCGGKVTLLLEPVLPPGLTLYLFGAGHVGREVASVLGGLPGIAIQWIDPREDEFPAAVPTGIRRIVSDVPEAEVLEAPADAAFLVMTHSHELDLRLVETVLRRGAFRWLGLIGSATKRARFEKRLAARGLDPARLSCPVGVAGIRDKHPRAIAIAVAADILRLAELPCLAPIPVAAAAVAVRD
ncbi:xanthine dehydrogenase accessory protein XdhC [Arenibaculum pallidiluteum]|uniref:xanthine dehydrogenase accessory protein XdhC n=1 Tax=Arenibaculum pallidiluteum TaxID=2812559 RepID=UPI001A96A70E|nr:xanthine dehydrogenase accessory protein XdhC [Arenibaculum pallidiluteum]